MSSSHRSTLHIVITLVVLIGSLAGCSSKPQSPQKPEPSATTVALTPAESLQSLDSVDPEYTLALPATFGRWTGDWDEPSKPQHNVLRLLVVYNKPGFFYDKGLPRGVVADMAQEQKKVREAAMKELQDSSRFCIPTDLPFVGRLCTISGPLQA